MTRDPPSRTCATRWSSRRDSARSRREGRAGRPGRDISPEVSGAVHHGHRRFSTTQSTAGRAVDPGRWRMVAPRSGCRTRRTTARARLPRPGRPPARGLFGRVLSRWKVRRRAVLRPIPGSRAGRSALDRAHCQPATNGGVGTFRISVAAGRPRRCASRRRRSPDRRGIRRRPSNTAGSMRPRTVPRPSAVTRTMPPPAVVSMVRFASSLCSCCSRPCTCCPS